MYKWTLKETSQKDFNQGIEDIRLYETPLKGLFHYTSREVFWKILESETMLARHIMFSNDYEENKIGTQKIADGMKQNDMQFQEPETLPFMICFCEKEDLLSQWRGYANEGIAMEFDFSKGLYSYKGGFSTYHCYTIMNNEGGNSEETYLSNLSTLKNGTIKKEEYFIGAIASPYHVIYTDSNKQVGQDVLDKIKSIKENDKPENRQKYAIGMIPYIKNEKFDEEKEYRLIFDMNMLLSESNRQILTQKYVYLDVNGIKKPNIRIKFGNETDKNNESTTAYYSGKELEKSLRMLQSELRKENIEIKLIHKPRKFKMQPNEIVISNSKFQKEICVELRKALNSPAYTGPKAKVWCDGHLPIRRIIVGPSRDAELMKDSIKEYQKTKYWMEDIEVEISGIPLRT